MSRAQVSLRCLVGALSLGATCGLASSPLGWHLVQWVGLLPLLWAWEGLDRRASLLAGLSAGFGVNLALFSWLGPSTMDYAGLSPGLAGLALLVFLGWEALPFAILGLVDWAGRRRWPGARWLVFPCALVLLEWLWPRLFAWTVGTPQVNAERIAQCADLVGPYGLSALVAFVNAALYQAWRGGARRPLAGAALALALALGYGEWQLRRWSRPAAATLRVGWVQPNRALNDLRPDTPAQVWEALREGVAGLGSCDLVVLPEGGAPAPLTIPAEGLADLSPAQARLLAQTRARARSLERELRGLAQRAPLLVGVTRRVVRPLDGERLEVRRRHNAVLLVGPEGLRGWVAKRRLLPLAEYLPGEGALPALRRLLPFAGRFEPGPPTPLLEVERESGAAASVGVLICYEAVWPRPLGAELPDLWVNPTNDVWFRGQGPALHAMISRLRAIESRRCLVRATTTGISYVLDPAGRTLAGAPRGRAAAGVLPLALPREVPLYPRLGDWPAWLAALVVALLARAGFRARAGQGSGREGHALGK